MSTSRRSDVAAPGWGDVTDARFTLRPESSGGAAQHSLLRGVRIRMRDGVELVADVHLPGGEGPFATLLQRTPYDRSDPWGTQVIAQLTIVRALDSGFAVVVQDTRGRF